MPRLMSVDEQYETSENLKAMITTSKKHPGADNQVEMFSRRLEKEVFYIIENEESSEAEIKQYFKTMHINFQSAYAVSFSCQWLSGEKQVPKSFFKVRFLEQVRRHCNEKRIALIVGTLGEDIGMFFIFQDKCDEEEGKKQIAYLISESMGMMDKYLCYKMSDYIVKVGMLRRAMLQANNRMAITQQALEDYYPYALERKLIEVLNRGKKESALEVVEEIANQFKEHYSYRSAFNNKVIELYTMIKRNNGIQRSGNTQLFEYQDELVNKVSNKEEMISFFKLLLPRLASNNMERIMQSDEFIGAVSDYVAKHYKHNIPLEEISNYIGFSTCYFTKMMKENFHMCFVDYLTQVRIEKAKELLQSTGKNVSEVSYEVGYEDPNYFTKVFKKIVGMPPRNYKQNCVL